MSTKKQEIHESSHIHEHEHEHEHGHPHTHEHEHGHHHKNTKAVLNRMSRAIGHMEAVRTMIEDGRDCSEVLIQIAAVRSAINNIGKIILEDHINHCVVDAVETGFSIQHFSHSIPGSFPISSPRTMLYLPVQKMCWHSHIFLYIPQLRYLK